ncbi:zinc-finger of transposase IS204/IS1001/IS1096/IS1165 [Clostridium cavendishii DSM 21758]|uniref:Zinc-finger of transposase IS204/IS1001/IS1096/IS1165 n=1 Tax=Clostridium cavendishii DSM 21758 TaxID=1121302 RepID=A0A1M6MK46_9CLOT|nr:transposase family protein [Clostridium cavendishii]SHJ83764.1 zinc-finger of transposase IS204/IS1001/IS1096/IS1165 [Clostridium cavendishii DSM 21758]
MINEAFLSNFTVEKLEVNEERVLIILKLNNFEAKCTWCGKSTSKVHSKYERKILDLPILDKYIRPIVRERRFFCNNDSCPRKIFSEEFSEFLLRYKRLTERLSNYLFKLGLSQSDNQCHMLFKKYIPVSYSSILRLTKNYNITVKYDAEFIAIDDFSFRKGVTFGSIICDLKTGKPIDIINSRNLDDVTAHLKLYKNVKIVSRDRFKTYAKVLDNLQFDLLK